MELKNFFAQDTKGNVVPFATVTVYNQGTTVRPTIYGVDENAITNPFNVGNTGLAQFRAANGEYDVKVITTDGKYTLTMQCNDVGDTVAAAEAAAAEADRAETEADRSEQEADRAETARDAAQLTAGVYADVATGIGNTTGGDHFNVPSSGAAEFLILYRNDAGTATELGRYPSMQAVNGLDSLTLNRGKPYPLKQATRAGITSSESTYWNDVLLNVDVINARPGEIYRVAYQQNFASLDGETTYDWIIEAGDEATYEDTGDTTVIVGYQKSVYGAQEQLDPNGGIQTVRLYPIDRPDMRIDITLDADGLPAAGLAINSVGLNSNDAWSWIIDPSCYQMRLESAPVDSIVVNRGQVAPLRATERGGTVSESSDFLLNAILDIQVVGAQAGYFYAIRYFKNGNTVLSGPQDGWQIEEVPATGYSDSVFSTNNLVVNYQDPAPDIDRSIGIQTIKIEAPDRDLVFYITLDPQHFPAFGSAVRSNYESDPGFTWIIDPSCYQHERHQVVPESHDGLSYSTASDGTADVIWKSGSDLFKVVFGPNGANDLPNFSSIHRAAGNDGPFTLVSGFGTDWLPPLVFNADAESGDGFSFTGGNHLQDGQQTARNVLYRILADGAPLEFGDSGTCERLTFLVVNEVMAGNTVSLGRYAARQTFSVDFYPGAAEVKCEVRALESIRMKSDYGPQLVSTGFNDTQLILDGQYAGRIAFSGDNDSGAFSDYPDAWAVILQSADNGQLASWLDHSYGVGDGAHVAPDEPRIRGGGSTSSKQYHAAIRNRTSPLQMAAGDTYRWRGGYAWQAPSIQPQGFDSTLALRMGGASHDAVVISADEYSLLP